MEILYKSAELKAISDINLTMPSLPKDGQHMLTLFLDYLANTEDRNKALWVEGTTTTSKKIEMPGKSQEWFSDNQVSVIICNGDLIIEGDLINDDGGSGRLFLIVTGTLKIHSWWRGGTTTFIGGNVVAKGCLVGEYNDSGLFVGGNLQADGGYIYRRLPYPDFPEIKPHQISGQIKARTFDATRDNITAEEVRSTFTPEVLYHDDDGVWYDPWKIIEHCAKGLSIWKI